LRIVIQGRTDIGFTRYRRINLIQVGNSRLGGGEAREPGIREQA
jgi:hypothetical protein